MDQELIQEIQFIEQNLQQILYQKQAFQLELNETESALSELENSEEEVFKLIGQLMIKSNKVKMKEELENKTKMIQTRLKTFESQERALSEKLEEFRKNLMASKNDSEE